MINYFSISGDSKQQKVVVWPQLPGGLGVLDFVVRTTQNYHFFDVTPNLMLKIAQVAQGEYVAPEKLEQIYSKSFYISQVKALFNYYGYYG